MTMHKTGALIAVWLMVLLPDGVACPMSRRVDEIVGSIDRCVAAGFLNEVKACGSVREKAIRGVDWVLFDDKRAFDVYKNSVDELIKCGRPRNSLTTVFGAILLAQNHNFSAQCHLLACMGKLTTVGGHIWDLAQDDKLPYPKVRHGQPIPLDGLFRTPLDGLQPTIERR